MKAFVQSCLLIAGAVLGDTRMRRQWMFYLTLLLLLFVFGGLQPGMNWWKDHPLLFGFYLIGSFVGVILLMLLALFDMLMVLKQFRQEKREAAAELRQGVKHDRQG